MTPTSQHPLLTQFAERRAKRKEAYNSYREFLAKTLCDDTARRFDAETQLRVAEAPNKFTKRSRKCYNHLEKSIDCLLKKIVGEKIPTESAYGSSCIAHDYVTRVVAMKAGRGFDDTIEKIKNPLTASNLFGNEMGVIALEEALLYDPTPLVRLAAATFSGNYIECWEPGIWTQSGGEIIGHSIEGVQNALFPQTK